MAIGVMWVTHKLGHNGHWFSENDGSFTLLGKGSFSFVEIKNKPLTCGFVLRPGSFQGVVGGFPTGKMPLGITRGKTHTTQETPPVKSERPLSTSGASLVGGRTPGEGNYPGSSLPTQPTVPAYV